MELGLFLILLVNIGIVSAGWNDPIYTKPEEFPCNANSIYDDEKCENWIFNTSSVLRTVYIKFEEEQKEPIKIAYIHCTDCDQEDKFPKVTVFTDGSSSVLGAKIQKESVETFSLIINNKLDYEDEDHRLFKFSIEQEDVAEDIKVKIDLIDIDDVKPQVTVDQTPCIIPENYAGATNCTFHLTDPDTQGLEGVKFLMDAQYEKHFEIKLDPITNKNEATAVLHVRDGNGNTLDFEKMPMYFFKLTVEDAGKNLGEAYIMIKVEDVNDTPPRWIDIFAMKTFEEHEDKTFQVHAQDGDLEINDVIIYSWKDKCHDNIELIPDGEKANIIIKGIDRDTQEMEDNDNTIKCTLIASEENAPTFKTEAEVSFIIQDINDNNPIITLSTLANSPIKLREEEFTTLEKIFAVNDIDQGNNAQFDITLENDDGVVRKIDYTEPFQVIPNNGYRNWEFAVSVVNAPMLDYDKTEDWRTFSLKIKSVDKGEPKAMEDSKIINIELQNLNDEIPEFDETINYKVQIREDAKIDTYILNVLATDDDYEDSVKYSLSQGGTEYKLTDETNNSATLYTAKDNVFDYEKVKIVYIQITATDTLTIPGEKDNFHTVNKQITVEVIDVNDETPRISLPTQISIPEHTAVGKPVTEEITAEDLDTSALLKFTINWNKSSVSKLGVTSKDTSLFEDVFAIETSFSDVNTNGSAIGILTVKNSNTLDYEVFDTIYLNIQVQDENQEINNGNDEGTLTVTIVDINDNAPEFNMDTINSAKKVTEHSNPGFKIATIIATDRDGINFNKVTYSIKEIQNTKPNLVRIDEITGELIVMSENIDADCDEYIEFLHYNVSATDGELFSPETPIKIEVEDKNERVPYLSKPLESKIIDERTSSMPRTFVQKVYGADCDRDDPHNKTNYEINNENVQLSEMFEIDEEGNIYAHGNLEWDNNKEMKIYFFIKDNIGGSGVSNREQFNFSVIIKDIDNNPPILPKPDDIKITPIREDTQIGAKITEIIATDKDEPCTENTKIKYTILTMKNSQDKDLPKDLIELIESEGSKPVCAQIAELKVKSSLKGYYGKISITIRAQNTKTEDNHSEETYEISVEPVNYEQPIILSPADSILILQENQKKGSKLVTIDGKYIADFEASDKQNDKFEMFFEPDTPWDNEFELIKKPDDQKNKARLTLTTDTPSKKEYSLKIRAKHDGRGDQQNFVTKSITVKLVKENQLPGFDDNTYMVKFWENETNEKCKTFPAAKDPKCGTGENDNCEYDTYYHIINIEEKDNFEMNINDKKQPQLCLKRWLDREEQEYHILTIVANNDALPPPKVPNGYEPLILTVEVEDVNDNPPSFVTNQFKGGLADTDKIDSNIVTLNATDPDKVDEGMLKYYILKDTIKVSDTSLDSIKNEAFEIVGDTIKNKRQPTQAMKGYFQFNVIVLDSSNFSDTAEVIIHIISDANRVIFKFKEDIDFVKSKSADIERIFTKEFGYSCTIDDYATKINETGATRATISFTEIKTHFVNEQQEPVTKDVISLKLEDIPTANKIKYQLSESGLTLEGVDSNSTATDEIDDLNTLLQILLIVVSVVLGTLCIILIVAFILRTRSLNKRLAAMTTNVFGSTKSDLNRIGISAPGTNRHAIEANPVWNEDLNSVNQFETMSQASGGSDLIGVEDTPDFASYDARRPSINPVMQQNLKTMQYDSDDYDDGHQNAAYDDDDDDIRSLPGSTKNNSTMF